MQHSPKAKRDSVCTHFSSANCNLSAYFNFPRSVNSGGTTLATHIWNLLSGENPNYELACAISIVILVVVLLLNITIKLIGKRINKFTEA